MLIEGRKTAGTCSVVVGWFVVRGVLIQRVRCSFFLLSYFYWRQHLPSSHSGQAITRQLISWMSAAAAAAVTTACAGGVCYPQHELPSGLPPPRTPHPGTVLPNTGQDSAAAQSLLRVWGGQLQRSSSSHQQQQQQWRCWQSRTPKLGCCHGPHTACAAGAR
jgi:hypothetical protein